MKVKLKDICEPKQWKTISTRVLLDKGYPVYGANGVIGYYNEYNHEKDTLLVTCRGATCGSLNISKGKSYINGNAMALDNLSDKVNIRYLYYYLKHRGLKDVISGSAQPQIIRSDIEKIEIDLKDIDIQNSMVELCEKIEMLITEQQQYIKQCDILIKSRFVEMFYNKGLTKIKIKEVVNTKIINVKSIYNKKDIIKYIDISSINNSLNQIVGYSDYCIEEAPSRAQQVVQCNDILVSTVRPNLKNVAIVKNNYNNLVASTGYCVLRPMNCLSEFLFYSVLDDKFTDRMTRIASGASYPAIHDSDVLNYEIMNPSIEVQNQFATFVQQVDKLKFDVQKSLEKTQMLFDSLMQEYFN